MKKRCGNCSMNGKTILNIGLTKASTVSFEYIILNEFCYLILLYHSKVAYK